MKRKHLIGLIVLTLILGTTGVTFGDIIDFTGGTGYLSGGGTVVPNNGTYWSGVDYYEENGFKLDFIGDNGIIGDYYEASNDVIHGHWGTGNYGVLTSIVVSKLDGNPFDLNYFILTSNTDTGGGAASGNEQTWINASTDGTTISYSQLLPPDDWGFVGTNPQIFLGSQFDNIMWFSFTVSNEVDCFGMDNFYINEPAPPPVPLPGAFLLGMLGLSVAGVKLRKHA